MLKKCNLFFLLVLVLVLALADTLGWGKSSIEPYFQKGLGTTLFRFEFYVPKGTPNDTLPENVQGLGQSELEYPLDPILFGLRYRLDTIKIKSKHFGFGISAWTNVSHPSGKMKDTDWIGARSTAGGNTATALFKISETLSRTEQDWYGGEATVDFLGGTLFTKPTKYGLTVRMEYFEYEMFGITGRQGFPGETPVFINTLHDTLVLTYQLFRIMPRIFMESHLAKTPTFSWKATISGAPAYAVDHDDHVLRKKESITTALGFEFGASSELGFPIAPRCELVTRAEFAYFRAKGEMDQNFYGDDPFTSEQNETGISIHGLTNRIIGLAGGISVGLKYLF